MRSRRLLAALSACALVLSGCAKAGPDGEVVEKAASVVPIPGTDRVRVRLTPDAVRRLDLKTGTVHNEPVPPRSSAPVVTAAAAPPAAEPADAAAAAAAATKGKKGAPATTTLPPPPPPPPTAPPAPGLSVRTVLPFGAVLYEASGQAFTYVSVEPELFERTPITVEYVVGDLAVLSAGPAPGAVVVTVGGPELSGAEFGVGE